LKIRRPKTALDVRRTDLSRLCRGASSVSVSTARLFFFRPQQREIDRANVARIARRVRSLLLPAVVMRFWTDENGWLMDVVELNLRGDERSSTSIAPEASEPVA